MPKIAQWEEAEIKRSSAEASHVDLKSLRINDTHRYLNPPSSTPYPLEYCCHLLGDIRGQTVLDLGCGTGENTLILALHGAKVYALDISQELVELARKRLEINNASTANVHFMVGSAHEIDLPDDSVDLVFGIAILHHLDLNLVSKEVFRILKNSGRAIFQEPVRDSAVIRFIRDLIPYRAADISPFERPLTTDELKQFSAPFRNFRIRAFDLPHVSLAGVLAPKLIPVAHKSDRKILDAIPFLGRYAAVRVFQVEK